MINTLYVGVDVSMKDFKVRYMDDPGDLKPLNVSALITTSLDLIPSLH